MSGTTPEALKGLYTALGGSAADVADLMQTPDLIAALANVAGGGSGGGSDRFVLNVTNGDGGTGLVTDAKWSELRTALESGKEIVCCMPYMGGGGVKEYIPFLYMESGEYSTYVYFEKITVQNSDSDIVTLSCNRIRALCSPSDDTISIQTTFSSRNFS